MPGSENGTPTRKPSMSFFSSPASAIASAETFAIRPSAVRSPGSLTGLSSPIPIAAAFPLRLIESLQSFCWLRDDYHKSRTERDSIQFTKRIGYGDGFEELFEMAFV